CSNNCKQIGLALQNYESAYKTLPPAWWLDIPPQMLNGKSWGTAILPFIEQENLYNQFNHNVLSVNETGPVGQANIEVMKAPLSFYVCPSAPGGTDRIYDGDASPDLPVTWSAAPSDYMSTT